MTKKKDKAKAEEQQDEKVAIEPEDSGQSEKQEAQPELTAEEAAIEIEELRAETDEIRDKFVRAKAETENVRRRAETDIANARKFAIEKFAAEVLTIRDSLELARSLELKEDDQEALNKMHEGLELTLKQFDTVFEKFQMEMVSPEGEKFNPDLHQAISMIESPEVAANHVVSVVQKGCTISERLLRPALVVVSNGKGAKKGENGEESAENKAKSS